MMALSRRVSNGSLLQCSGSLSNCPSRRAAEVKRTADASSSSEQVADCMAQQHKDSQDGFLSFSISSLSQGPDAESSLALEGLARERQSAAVPAHRPCQNRASSAESHWCVYVPPSRYPYMWDTSPVPITTDNGE